MKKYTLYGQEAKQNAYKTYEQMQQEDPVCPHIGFDGETTIWFITRYEDGEAILKDNKHFTKRYQSLFPPEKKAEMEAEMNPVERLMSRHLLNLDPPDHTRLRQLVNKVFTPRRVEQLRPRIQAIADELIDAVADKNEMELIDDYAFPLPIIVIGELLGVPTADRDKLRRWSDYFVSAARTDDEMEQAGAGLGEFVQYLQALFAERRANPQDDLISALILAEEDGDRISIEELFGLTVLLIVAGHETTVNLIANGILALLTHPEQLAKLKADWSLIDNTVEEILRYDNPVERSTARFVVEDFEYKGQTLKKRAPLLVVLGATGRDPEQFECPHQFDITRQNIKHLGFGAGIHYCLGAPLARLEGVIAIQTLLKRLPNLQLSVDPETLLWREQSLVVRGLQMLPVQW